MSRTRMRTVDHKILERTVASTKDTDFEEHEETPLNIEDLEPYLDKLPDREVDLIDMYYRANKKQKEIAAFFSISQGAVSHRLTRARNRLKFLRDMPKINDEHLMDKLNEIFNEVDAEVMFYMIRTTCQSRAADIVNKRKKLRDKKSKLTQVKVRHKFHKGVERLQELSQQDTTVGIVFDLAYYILDGGLYMLHEVKLPHFDKGSIVQMDMAGSY